MKLQPGTQIHISKGQWRALAAGFGGLVLLIIGSSIWLTIRGNEAMAPARARNDQVLAEFLRGHREGKGVAPTGTSSSTSAALGLIRRSTAHRITRHNSVGVGQAQSCYEIDLTGPGLEGAIVLMIDGKRDVPAVTYLAESSVFCSCRKRSHLVSLGC